MDDLTSLGTIQPAPQIPFMLRRVIGRYVRAFAPERILLFGSYAKGTSHEGSDIDLYVYGALHVAIPPYGKGARAATKTGSSRAPSSVPRRRKSGG